MTVIPPTTGRRGQPPIDFAHPRREESILRVWTFLSGLIASKIRLTTGAGTGKVLTSNAQGDGSWSSLIPATAASFSAETANQTGTLISSASGTYLVSLYVEITTAGSGGTFYASVSYTDDVGGPISLYPTASLPCNATGREQSVAVLRCAGGGIDYTFQIVGGAGTPKYNAYISVAQVAV